HGRPRRQPARDRRLPLDGNRIRAQRRPCAGGVARLAACRDAGRDAAARVRPAPRPPRCTLAVPRRSRRSGPRRRSDRGGGCCCRDQTDAAGGNTARGMTQPRVLIAEDVARLQALARRAGADGVIEAVGLRLDPVSHAVSCGSGSTSLTPTEFRLLARMLARPGETVRRRDLIRAGWPHGAIVHENTLDAYVARLRRKLRALEGAPPITTVHGVGYALQ